MKKFYAFAALAACAVSAMAQNGAPLYATGNCNESNWNPGEPAVFTYADDAYTLDLTNVSMFKISTVSGAEQDDAWGAFNSGALTCNYGEEPGVATDLAAGTDNIACPWAGDWHVVVAGDLSTITLTTTSAKPATAIYLRGDMNDGWAAEEAWKFESIDGNVYKFVCGDNQEIPFGTAFKIADSTWGKINYGINEGDEIFFDVEAVLAFNAGNIQLEDTFYGVCYFVLETADVFFSNDKDAECPFEINAVNAVETENAAPVYFNLQGVRVANPESGLYIVVSGNKTQKVVIK